MKPVYIVSLAIICITMIEIFALAKNMDGTLLSITIAAIAGLGGYEFHLFKDEP